MKYIVVSVLMDYDYVDDVEFVKAFDTYKEATNYISLYPKPSPILRIMELPDEVSTS